LLPCVCLQSRRHPHRQQIQFPVSVEAMIAQITRAPSTLATRSRAHHLPSARPVPSFHCPCEIRGYLIIIRSLGWSIHATEIVYLFAYAKGLLLHAFSDRYGLRRDEVILMLGCLCSCNRDERRCIPSPKEDGTLCGEDGDYYFGQCNTGPGFCKAVTSEFGSFGVCIGLPTFGVPCNDFDRCTINDKCKVIIADDGSLLGVCSGKFDADLPCNDYNDACTINDR
jgi:hypothetical protein